MGERRVRRARAASTPSPPRGPSRGRRRRPNAARISGNGPRPWSVDAPPRPRRSLRTRRDALGTAGAGAWTSTGSATSRGRSSRAAAGRISSGVAASWKGVAISVKTATFGFQRRKNHRGRASSRRELSQVPPRLERPGTPPRGLDRAGTRPPDGRAALREVVSGSRGTDDVATLRLRRFVRFAGQGSEAGREPNCTVP